MADYSWKNSVEKRKYTGQPVNVAPILRIVVTQPHPPSNTRPTTHTPALTAMAAADLKA
jgi:hypothetical protein